MKERSFLKMENGFQKFQKNKKNWTPLSENKHLIPMNTKSGALTPRQKAKVYRKYKKTHKGQKLAGYRRAKMNAPISAGKQITDFILKAKEKIQEFIYQNSKWN